ncbi:DUF1697 domain-containing protein [Mycolicibacterium tokaiense]|uniref:Pyridoxamine 5'-phosphate oxidase family protein n=1 Tax=Mycolicibacterium tokaiense TaxID=39695 RepID=A0A378TGM6_9MYCO|nr:DUF1697 domain-containing protein [Mycolicibacterium tokaiense]BBY85526.1 hypothetical protein MTOK_13080 [Mycolicibacterium tokaiense]STZ59962.1 pyridoxamine 5'-phosphate oxidase family protein [Mycolicibacterium tokaiense]
MASTSYVALLRGINVGGRNVVAMKDLRAAMEGHGFGNVRTYIQSGNVLFETDAPATALESEIEATLEKRFGVPLLVVVRSHRQLRAVVTKAPAGFGGDEHHCDVLFLKSPLTAATVMGVVELRDGVDQAWTGSGVVYFSRRSAERTRSKMSKIVGTPEYQRLTIRSWATTVKLLALLDN